MRSWLLVIGAVLALWLGYRYLVSPARLSLEQCIAALESAYPDIFSGLPAREDLREAELDAVRSSLAVRLGAADEPEARYLEVMLDRSGRGRIARVTGVLEPETDNRVLAWHGLRMCSTLPLTACPLETLETRMLALDGGNSEVWAQIAANRYERGDIAGALEALDWAARAPVANAYFFDTVELSERVLAAHSSLDLPWRLNQAFAIAAEQRLAYRDELLAICDEQALSADWIAACIGYGRALERRIRSRLGQAYGFGLQRAVADAAGDAARMAEIAAREAVWTGTAPSATDIRLVEAMLRSDPALLVGYLDIVRRGGEAAAVGRFIEQESAGVFESVGLGACAARL